MMRKGKYTIAKTVTVSALAAAMAVSMGATAAFAADPGQWNSDFTNIKATNTVTYAKEGLTLNGTYKLQIKGQGDVASLSISNKSDNLTGEEGKSPVISDTKALFTVDELNAIAAKGVGTYTFEVTETFTATNGTFADATPAKYTVQVQVKNKGTGTTNDYYVAAVVAKKADESKSNIDFATKYTKYANSEKTDGDEGDVSKGLTISKTVTGNDANYTDTFAYTITFTKDSVNEGLDLYTDSEIKLSGTAVEKGDNNHYNLAYDKEYTFTLKNGGSINFKVPAGTTYTVEETDTKNYTPSVTFVENGKEGEETKISSGKKVESAVAGEKENKVEFTNTKESNPITGLLTENAPFIAMVAAAAFALVGYVVYKRRRTN